MATFCRQCNRVISTNIYITTRMCKTCTRISRKQRTEQVKRYMEKRPCG